MIKFWKSAAKGKSGCPVRPPERLDDERNNYSLETIDENEDFSKCFNKISRLTMSLSDVVSNEMSVKYFIQYMEPTGHIVLIKCWIEIENFKTKCMTYNMINKSSSNNSKIQRTKSFDVQNNHETKTQLNRRYSCKLENEEYDTIGSLNSCHNCSNINCPDCKNHNTTNLTEEAISLFKKYVALEAPHKLDLPDNIRKMVITNICHPEGHIQEDCFKPVQEIVFYQMNSTYFEGFQKSPLYIKAQLDVLTNGSLTLNDILYNDSILFFFTEYLEQESCSLLLEFLIAIMYFRDNVTGDQAPGADQAQTDAIVLYQKYFSLQATSPIGFSTEVRLKVEEDICHEEGPLHNCFDLPYQIVYKTVSNYVKNFLDSEVYYKYLSEMINSVDQYSRSHKKTYSDCSSEISISTQNTLLAMGDSHFERRKRNYSVPDMTIDSNQLYNADSLWQRKRQDGLNLGRVNSLGRFESKLEPDPDKKRKSVLKKMVNKLVPSSSQVEEEMAWQIAHMIVKDVTDLTMAPPDDVS